MSYTPEGNFTNEEALETVSHFNYLDPILNSRVNINEGATE